MVGADFGANDWLNISPAAIEHRALLEASETHGGILILHDSHMHTAEALDDLITSFEQQGYRFVQLVPAPGALAAADLDRKAPILGSTAAADPRDGSGRPSPAGKLLRQVLDHLRDWAAHLAVFGRWLGAEIAHLWGAAWAKLRH